MKIKLTTRFTPEVEIYDSTDATPASIDWKKWLSPYVVITDNSDGEILHVGNQTENLFPLVIAGLTAITILFIMWVKK